MEFYCELLRSEYESYSISELIEVYKDSSMRYPRKGKMSEETYKKILINNLMKEQIRYSPTVSFLLKKGGCYKLNNHIAKSTKDAAFKSELIHKKYHNNEISI